MKSLQLAAVLVVGVVVGSILTSDSVEAHNTDVDWKFYGGTPYDGGELCFYEALSVARNGDHLRVWTKCLSEAAISKFDLDVGMTHRAATNIGSYYALPYNKAHDIDGNQAVTITIYEEIATNGYLTPPIRIFYEIECREGRLRTLSTDMTINGHHSSSNTADEWSYIGPEGNGATLRKILCDAR